MGHRHNITCHFIAMLRIPPLAAPMRSAESLCHWPISLAICHLAIYHRSTPILKSTRSSQYGNHLHCLLNTNLRFIIDFLQSLPSSFSSSSSSTMLRPMSATDTLLTLGVTTAPTPPIRDCIWIRIYTCTSFLELSASVSWVKHSSHDGTEPPHYGGNQITHTYSTKRLGWRADNVDVGISAVSQFTIDMRCHGGISTPKAQANRRKEAVVKSSATTLSERIGQLTSETPSSAFSYWIFLIN